MSPKQSAIAVNKRIGQWLRDRRLEAGLSQRAVARFIGHHRSFVAKYEAGRALEVCEAVAICLSIGADPHELVKMVRG